MRVVDIHAAKTHLSRLVGGASRRIGFLAGQIGVPDDFDWMGEAEIGAMLGL